MDRMRTPLLPPLTEDERVALKAGLRSPDAFTLRRCQVLLASAEGARPAAIAARFGCASQSVRDAIRALAAEGLDCLRAKSHRPRTVRPELNEGACRRLQAMLHQSPRDFGKPTSSWTLDLAAEVAHAEGITARLVSDETIRQALMRLGVGRRRAKTWITSPDPAYQRKEGRATA